MGCCSSRNSFGGKKEKIQNFIEKSGLSKLGVNELKRLDTQILRNKLDSENFEVFAKSLNMNLNFSLLEVQGFVDKFDLISALLLFSNEIFDKKKSAFREIVNNDRKIMRFVEWKFQLIHERVPIEIAKSESNQDFAEIVKFVKKNRVQAFEVVNCDYLGAKEGSDIELLRILYIN